VAILAGCYSDLGVDLRYQTSLIPASAAKQTAGRASFIPAANAYVPPDRIAWDAAVRDPTRKIGYYLGLAFIFLRFSMLHETLATLLHVNLYLALLTGFPAIILSIAGGGLKRACQSRGGKFLMAFLFFMAVAVPFSTWRGESVSIFTSYVRADFPLLFILGGMALTWKECKWMLIALALSAVSTIAMERLFSGMGEDGRLSLNSSGTISNSNDYAAHLIVLLPFLLWVILTPSAKIWKALSLGFLIFGLLVVLKTGSRGAFIGLIAGFVVILLRGPGRLRWILGIAAPIALFAILTFLPESLMVRYSGILGSAAPSASASQAEVTAEDSTSARKYLLMTSLKFTIEHPLLGVGPGAFSMYEGGTSQRLLGKNGQWQETHNAYTEVSSEVGIPAVICYLGAIVCTFLSLNRIMTFGRKNKIPVLTATAFCSLLSFTMLCAAMAFLTLGYRFYLPALCGLSIALERVMRMEFSQSVHPPALAGASRPGSFVRQTSPVRRIALPR